MGTKLITPLVGRDCSLHPTGALVVAHPAPDFREPYRSAPIPNYRSLIDHTQRIGKKHETRSLAELEKELSEIVYFHLVPSGRSAIFEFEGIDGAGKTGARKRITRALGDNVKVCTAEAFGKPSTEELNHHWLWKYQTHEKLPGKGQIRCFDRGPSERMLVERVKKLAKRDDLNSSYNQLNAWQWYLTQTGTIYRKFWLDITKSEQTKRFEDREKDHKEKITPDDYENQKLRPKFMLPINEMFHRTGTVYAPWYLISGEDKRYSRVTVFTLVVESLKAELGL